MSAQPPEPVFQVGSFVRWFADGPVMVVKHIEHRDTDGTIAWVDCRWFSPDDHHHETSFPADQLVPAQPPTS